MNKIVDVPKAEQKLVKSLVEVVPDFPKPGVGFLDIGGLLLDHNAMEAVIGFMCEQAHVWKANKVLGLDARGFIFAAQISQKSGLPLIMARKKGKLPGVLYESSLEKEYGSDAIAIQRSRLVAGDRVLIVDDVIATGGTLLAVRSLIESSQAEVAGIVALADIVHLGGSRKLSSDIFPTPVNSFLKYE